MRKSYANILAKSRLRRHSCGVFLSASGQINIFSKEDEAGCYLNSRHGGFFSVLANVNGNKRQSSHRLSELPQVLELIKPNQDTWITQAEFFRPNRRVVNLASIGQLFTDLDTYNQPWAKGRNPQQLAECVKFFINEAGLPPPSIIVFSGRGLQVKWLLTSALPRQALPRWNAVQSKLIELLEEAGADRNARDASRVLRVVQTINSKSGEICRVLDVKNGIDGEPIRYNFELLAENLLPFGRGQLEESRKNPKLKIHKGGKIAGLKGFSGNELAWHRLEDLRTLAELRGGVGEKEKTTHLFWRLNFLLLSGATNHAQMYCEAAALANEICPKWGYRSKELMTLYDKAKRHSAGEKVEFDGRQLTPLYTPKNDRLISIFGITDNEQRSLKTIISSDMAAERHRTREEARRRATGVMAREAYLEQAKNKTEQAKALREKGLSVRAIAAEIGSSKTAVSRYLSAV